MPSPVPPPRMPVPPLALVERLRKAHHIVVLTGAGMSAESGIATFREKDEGGLWSQFDPLTLATPEAFQRDPETVWAWYEWRRQRVARAIPNAGHLALTALASRPQLQSFCIVTQNVDDLHERAGARTVLHLHGSLFAPRCFSCGRAFTGLTNGPMDEEEVRTLRLAPPRCASCHGRIRPGVVWFGESPPEAVWLEALRQVEAADLLLVVGTSGLVYPAASLPEAARRQGCNVAVLNPDASALSDRNGLDWQVSAAVGLPALLRALDP